MKRYFKSLAGLTKEQLHTFFSELANKMKDDFNEKVIARIKQHAKEGIYNMVVSGAFTPLLSAATKDFPIDQLIGTEILIQNGVIKTDIKIYHIQAPQNNATIHST